MEWGFWDMLYAYSFLMWKSFAATLMSGTSMGVAFGFALATLLMLMTLWMINRIFRFRKTRIKQLVRVMRGKRMSATDREEYERVLLSDGIQDLLDELFLLGKITGEKRKWWAREIGQKLKLNDLLEYDEVVLKEKIKRRLAKEHGVVVEFPKAVPEPRLKKFAGGKLFKQQTA